MSKEVKNIEDAQDRVQTLINTIYDAGDRDECSIKHILHGLAMLLVGEDPSIQSNYLDYSNAGCMTILSDFEDDIFVKSAFQEVLWDEVEQLYDKWDEEVLDLVAEQGYMMGVDFYMGMYINR